MGGWAHISSVPLHMDRNLHCEVERHALGQVSFRSLQHQSMPRQIIRLSLVRSQSKGLSKHQRRADWLHTGPSPPPEAESQVGSSQSWKAKGCYNLGPRDWHPPPN